MPNAALAAAAEECMPDCEQALQTPQRLSRAACHVVQALQRGARGVGWRRARSGTGFPLL